MRDESSSGITGTQFANTAFITISCKATKSPTTGHEFWLHQSLLIELRQRKLSAALVVGAFSEDSESVKGVLRHPWSSRNISAVFIWAGFLGDLRRVLKTIDQSDGETKIVHIYEGGFREFALYASIAKLRPNYKFIFNFNLTDPWFKLVERASDSTTSFALKYAAKVLAVNSWNTVPFAEIPALGEPLSQLLKCEIRTYPLHSSVTSSQNRNHERVIQLLMIPNGERELDFCLEVCRNIREKGSKARLVINPRWGDMAHQTSMDILNDLGVEVVSGLMDSAAYRELYESSRFTLFPYFSDYYKNTSSGRLLDSAVCGSTCIVPCGSSLAAEVLGNGWGHVLEENTPSEVANLIMAPRKPAQTRPTRPTPSRTVDVLFRQVGDLHPSTFGVNHRNYSVLGSVTAMTIANLELGIMTSLGRIADAFGLRSIVSGVKKMMKVGQP